METKKVLLIGKSDKITKNIRQLLSNYFEVQSTSDNVEIIRGMLELGRYDIIVMNLVDWEKEKTGVFKELEQKCTRIPIICVGQDEDFTFAQKNLSLEIVRWIGVPIINEKLLNMVGMLLDVQIQYSEEEIQCVVQEATTSTEKSKKHILLVDDSPIQLRNLREILKGKYEVSVAPSGAAAMVILGKKLPDLIFLDYEMPICNGKMVFEKLRNNEGTKNIPVVFLTGLNDVKHIQEVLSLNPEGYLLKPVTKDRIMQTIEKLLGE